MSGIVGIYHTDGRPVEEADVEQMLQRIAHRGPDGVGKWVSGSVGLGHRMLCTTPESLREQQPLANQDRQVWLTADARVDNRDELRQALLACGQTLRNDTDAELILQSYECWGDDCAARIIGDFAFATWDDRRKRLFCARDAMGVKPFFYRFDGKDFRWASSPLALLGSGNSSAEPNLGAVSRLLLDRFNNNEETLFKDLLRLPLGHCLVCDALGCRKYQYWDFDPKHTVRYATEQEYVDHFLDLFRTAVEARLRSHVPLGAFLSGGLDSASVVSVAQESVSDGPSHRQPPVYGLSVLFEQPECDERCYIEEVSRRCQLPVNYYSQPEHASWLDFERAQDFRDSFYAPTLFMLGPALTDARQAGTRAVLTGAGGDEWTASKIIHLTDLMRQNRLAALFRQLKWDAELTGFSRWALFRTYCLRPMLRPAVRRLLSPLGVPRKSRSRKEWFTDSCFHYAAENAVSDSPFEVGEYPTVVQRHLRDNLRSGWNSNVALGRLEAFASQFFVECRHPFLDRRLVEFMFAVPEELRWFGAERKVILRRAMTTRLPELVRTRSTKANFTPFVDVEFKERQGEKAERYLRDSILGEMQLIHVNRFLELYRQYRFGQVTPQDRRACQNAVGLELWLRSAIRHYV